MSRARLPRWGQAATSYEILQGANEHQALKVAIGFVQALILYNEAEPTRHTA